MDDISFYSIDFWKVICQKKSVFFASLKNTSTITITDVNTVDFFLAKSIEIFWIIVAP
jgi:hypothetical protein